MFVGLIIQYGFNVIGFNVNFVNEVVLGSVIISDMVVFVNDFNFEIEVSVYFNLIVEVFFIKSVILVQVFQVLNFLGQ